MNAAAACSDERSSSDEWAAAVMNGHSVHVIPASNVFKYSLSDRNETKKPRTQNGSKFEKK